jgi:molybdopterin converting factor small subunit
MIPSSATLIFQSTGPKKGQERVEVTSGQSIQEALSSLHRSSRQPHVPVVNGTTQDLTYLLQPGDVVTFLPQISGG